MKLKEQIEKLKSYQERLGDDIPVYIEEWDGADYVVSIDHTNLHIGVIGGETYISLVEGNEG